MMTEVIKEKTTEQLLGEIFDFIFHNHGDFAQLRIGIWDEESHTFYAVIVEVQTGDIIAGESTYGVGTIEQALIYLLDEISTRRRFFYCPIVKPQRNNEIQSNHPAQ